MHDEMTPTYWAVRCDLAPRPAPGGRHRWEGAPQALRTSARRRHAIDTPTEVIPVARHYDLDGDHIADHEGDYEVCDDRPRDGDGNLVDGLPDRDDGPEA